MAAPAGYDVGFQHSSVNVGVAVGFLLDEEDPDAFVEERQFETDVKVTTGGEVTVSSYGTGAIFYTLRLLLRTSVMRRNVTGTAEVPAALRTTLLQFAAVADGTVELQRDEGDRRVAFVDDIKFISAPSRDGYVAVVKLADLGAG